MAILWFLEVCFLHHLGSGNAMIRVSGIEETKFFDSFDNPGSRAVPREHRRRARLGPHHATSTIVFPKFAPPSMPIVGANGPG